MQKITQQARCLRQNLARRRKNEAGVPFGRRGRGRENGFRCPAGRPRMTYSKTAAIRTAIAITASLFRVGCMSGGHGVKRMTGAEGSATSPGGCPGPQPEAASTGSRPRQLEPWRGCSPVAGSAPRSTRPTGYMRPVCGKPRRRPVQAGCPPAGTIPIPATQGRLRQPTPTDRPAASTVGNNSSP